MNENNENGFDAGGPAPEAEPVEEQLAEWGRLLRGIVSASREAALAPDQATGLVEWLADCMDPPQREVAPPSELTGVQMRVLARAWQRSAGPGVSRAVIWGPSKEPEEVA